MCIEVATHGLSPAEVDEPWRGIMTLGDGSRVETWMPMAGQDDRIDRHPPYRVTRPDLADLEFATLGSVLAYVTEQHPPTETTGRTNGIGP